MAMTSFTLFDERKTAQAAACLLFMAGGGKMPLIKLMKLMYLAERISLQRYGETITGDAFVCMKHGPVLSTTYDYMSGSIESSKDGWESWISDRDNHELTIRTGCEISSPEEDLLALSETDLECLASAWQQYGHLSRWEIRDLTHSDACPEWEDPGNTSRPLPVSRILKAVGYEPEQVEAISRRLHEQRFVQAALV